MRKKILIIAIAAFLVLGFMPISPTLYLHQKLIDTFHYECKFKLAPNRHYNELIVIFS